MDLDQPVDEDGAHLLVDRGLALHVSGAARGLSLNGTEVLVLRGVGWGGGVVVVRNVMNVLKGLSV